MTMEGFEVVFATENGTAPKADTMLTNPEGFVMKTLAAEYEARQFYKEMEQSGSFQAPISWGSIRPADYNGLLLAGGHAPGMKQYLESSTLRAKILEFWKLNRPVAAICHGALCLARTKDENGKSVLWNKKTTTLPTYMELLAYNLSRWQYGKLFRTYEITCEEEVKSHLQDGETQFIRGVPTIMKGNAYDDSSAFVCEDENYISARWPGDAYLLGKKFIKLMYGPSTGSSSNINASSTNSKEEVIENRNGKEETEMSGDVIKPDDEIVNL